MSESRRNRPRGNQGRENQNYRYENINIPLSEYYKGKEIYLPEGITDKISKDFKPVSSSQLRKILSIVKQALDNKDDEKSMKYIYSIVPLTAYNCGRNKKDLELLYKFVITHINQKSIKTRKDIETFDEVFSNIIAYHKINGGK